MKRTRKTCQHCIMDTTDPDIEFTEEGICNHCKTYDERARTELYYDRKGQEKLHKLIDVIKKDGKRKKYDCILGVSGGADSSFVAYKAKQLGLRPLAVHVDNAWNSELAEKNIKQLCKNLDLDLHTYCVDLEEFKDIQLALLRASVVNIEMVTDHLYMAYKYHLANKMGLDYILSGQNIVTEASQPDAWGFDFKDWRHIADIHKTWGNVELRTFPRLTLFHWFYYIFLKGIKYISLLNYIHYVKKDAVKFLEQNFNFNYYEQKHYESIFTRFYQGYILPKKFGIDKRKGYLSCLIRSGQLTREEALEEMKRSIYPENQLREDKAYVLEGLGMTESEFEELMSIRPKSHCEYKSIQPIVKRLSFLVKFTKKLATYRR